MRKFACATFVAATALLPMTTAATASAEGAGTTQMPLANNLRACDNSHLDYVFAREYGRGFAEVSTPGSNTVAAKFTLETAEPFTHYDVRIIQVPRPTNNCAPGDAGVIAGGFETDGAGNGGTTIQGPIKSGATGAWVAIDRPAANTQTPAEFYTSDFIASI
jgi:hypothetical protein